MAQNHERERTILRIQAGSVAVTDKMSDKDRRELESTMNQEVLGRGPVLRVARSSRVHHPAKISVAGGALKVKDELKCAFDIVGRKKEDNS